MDYRRQKLSLARVYLVVASLAPLCEGLVPLQSLLTQQGELLHVHQLQGQVQRRLQLLHLTDRSTSQTRSRGLIEACCVSKWFELI